MAKKILIVENDAFLGDVLEKKLKNAEYDVHLVRDGILGMKALKELQPDLVLLDMLVPDMDGYEILKEKLSNQKISKIPVIVISHSGESGEIDRILSLGAKDYFLKAEFAPEEVLDKVALQLKEPEKENKDKKEEPSPSPKVSLKGKKIVWVEDDIFLSEIVSKKLSNHGGKIFHEIEGEAGLKTIEKEMPDIIMLDVLLSGIDGFEILKKLKENPKVKAIPVIMLSNLGQKSDIDKAKNLGAERFLIKAMVSLDEIVDEIKTVIEKNNK